MKPYGPEVNLLVDHSQIVQLECLRAGIWHGETWGRLHRYRPVNDGGPRFRVGHDGNIGSAHPRSRGSGWVGGGEPVPRIEGYRFGRVVIDREEHTRDVIVLPERVVSGWWRADGHRLVLVDLEDVIEELPERLVVGTGAYGQMRPAPEALEQLRRRGVEVEALPTGEAVRRYCQRDPRRTAAALHLTC